MTYASWVKMRHKPRGHTGVVPKEWESFRAFLMEMGERPSLLHGLRRLNKELPYSKENCRWATKAEMSNLYSTHGESGTDLYKLWKSAKHRCRDSSQPNYGGRGIQMCQEWQESFLAFKDAMGPRPSREMTLERMDNNKGYEPGNVCWATRKEQANNVRRNVMVSAFGKTQTIAEWADEKGLNYQTLRRRIRVALINPEEALLMP